MRGSVCAERKYEGHICVMRSTKISKISYFFREVLFAQACSRLFLIRVNLENDHTPKSHEVDFLESWLIAGPAGENCTATYSSPMLSRQALKIGCFFNPPF